MTPDNKLGTLPIIERRKKIVDHVTDNAATTLRAVLLPTCQWKCTFCYEEGGDYKNDKVNLSSDTFIRTILEASRVGFKKVNFTGGEPLLYPDVFKVQDAAMDAGLTGYLTTNAAMIPTRKAYEVWKDYPKDKFEAHVSVHTLDDAEFRELTKTRQLKQSLQGLELLAKHSIPFNVNTVITSPEGWDTAKKVIEFAGELGNGAIVKLMGVHDAEDRPFFQADVAQLLLDKGAERVGTSDGIGNNFGFDDFKVGKTNVHVMTMVYGGGCCDRYKSAECGEGIRYPRVSYTGEIKPCLHIGNGSISNESSDQEIGEALQSASEFVRNLAKPPYTIDSLDTRGDLVNIKPKPRIPGLINLDLTPKKRVPKA